MVIASPVVHVLRDSSRLISTTFWRTSLVCQVHYAPPMDIARPDLKQKKKKERQRRVGIGVAAILAVAVLFLVRFEEAPHHREYV
ncbi:MAG TPA: hypothetical protein VGI45_18890, partial [Terracidiphilus sp.]